jgi:hypothetical protein
MSTDGQGRPLSDDGQWAWTGTEWVPAALGSGPSPGQPADRNATIIAPSPFAAGAGPGAGQAGYGSASIANQPAQGYGATPAGYGATPSGYVVAAPAGYGAPLPAARSRKPVFIGIAAVVGLVAVAVVLIVTLVGSKKSGPLGAFSCTAPGRTGTGVITFKKGNVFTLDDDPVQRAFVKSGDRLAFNGGQLNGIVATYDSGAKILRMTLSGELLTCKG